MARTKKLNFIDLFAGAGGLSCGLEQAGFNCILGVDFNKYAMQTFAKNHPKATSFCGDIAELKGKSLKEALQNKEIHLVVGGPPCQGFSTVGPGNPDDLRNTLFLEFCRIVRTTKPYFVVMENVTGLLAKKNERTLNSIIRKFKTMGYKLEVKVLESQHYGVPEKRKRTIFIGSRLEGQIVFPTKTHDTKIKNYFVPAVTVGEAIKNVSTAKGKALNHDIDSAQIKDKLDLKRIKRIPEGKGIRYEADEKKYLTPSLKLGVDWNEMRENRFRQTKYYRLERSKPSPTIMTHRHTYYHPIENRYLTQREAAAIQSFPNDFEFCGPLSAQWRQIGNAVPPLLAKAIGKSLLKMLKNSHNKKKPSDNKRSMKTENIENIRSRAFVYKETNAKDA